MQSKVLFKCCLIVTVKLGLIILSRNDCSSVVLFLLCVTYFLHLFCQAAQSLLKIARKASPLKFKSSVKRRRSWTTSEETALVQFVALHQEYLPIVKSWPSFGSKNAYWEEAAKYVNQSIKSPIRFRSDESIYELISLYFMESAVM